MKVELPDGGWADLVTREEITERQNRLIDRARTKVVNISARLISSGYDPPESWGDISDEDKQAKTLSNLEVLTGISDEDSDAMNAYQSTLISTLVKEWSYDLAVTDALDLPQTTFEALAAECAKVLEVNLDFSAE